MHTKTGIMNLHDYLKCNTLVREELLNYKLFYDLKLAAAERLYHLKIFESTVDVEGFDVMLDDNCKVCRFQLKSKYIASTRILKKIHSVMLLPNKYDANILKINNGLCPSQDNGLVLIDVRVNRAEGTIIQYYYLDFYILFAIARGLFTDKKRNQDKAQKIINEVLDTKSRSSRIDIPISLMLKIKDSASLLAICGFDSTEDFTHRHSFMKIFNKTTETKEDWEIDSFKKIYRDCINSLRVK
jgi:hypothetical protein